MLSIFRTNQEFIGILVIPFILLFLGTAWWEVPLINADPAYGPFGDLMQVWGEKHPLGNLIIVGALLLIMAFWLNILIIRNRLNREFNLFPGLILVFMSLAVAAFKPMSVVVIANFCFLFALSHAFSIYKKSDVAGNIFNIGFWIGLASLFYSPFIFLLVWGFLTLNSIRAGSIREFLNLLSGAAVVYFLAATWCFYTGDLQAFANTVFDSFQIIQFQESPTTNDWILIASFAILLFIVLASFGAYQVKKSIEVQKKISSLYFALLATGLAFIFQVEPSAILFLMLVIPMSIFLAFSITDLSPNLAEVVFVIVLLGLFGLQYGTHLL